MTRLPRRGGVLGRLQLVRVQRAEPDAGAPLTAAARRDGEVALPELAQDAASARIAPPSARAVAEPGPAEAESAAAAELARAASEPAHAAVELGRAAAESGRAAAAFEQGFTAAEASPAAESGRAAAAAFEQGFTAAEESPAAESGRAAAAAFDRAWTAAEGSAEEVGRSSEAIVEPARTAAETSPLADSARAAAVAFEQAWTPAEVAELAVAARGQSPAAPPLDAAALAARDRREKEVLGEFTRSLVQTLNRTSYYDPEHPALQGLGTGLFECLDELLREQPQIGYLLTRGTPAEVLVDGLPAGRVKLDDILPPGIFELFAPRFIDYFERYGLVMLAFRRGLDRDEFERFVAVMSRPVTSREQAFDLLDTLVAEDVLNVSTLCWKEIDAGQGGLPWQVRVCLARLRRDLRTLPMFHHADRQALRKKRLRILSDVIGPLGQIHHLKLAVLHAPRIQADVGAIAELEGEPIETLVIGSIRRHRLLELARSLIDELGHEPAQRCAPWDEIARTLRLCAARFAAEDIKEAEPLWCQLYEFRVLEFSDLPVDLQEWLIAEEGEKRMVAGTLADLPTATAREVRVLGKLSRLLFVDGHVEEATTVLSLLAELQQLEDERGGAAAGAVGEAMSDQELDELTLRIEEGTASEAVRFAPLLRCLAQRAGAALVERVVQCGPQARFGNLYHLLDEMPEIALEAVAAALRRPVLPAPVLRVLLALGQRHPHPEVARAALAHTTNPEPRLRLMALAAAASGAGPETASVLRRALDDADDEVAVFAMTKLEERPGAAEVLRAHAVKVLEGATRETPGPLLLAAVRQLAHHPGRPDQRPQAVAAVRQLVEREQGGFLRRAPAHPEVIEPARAALVALGAEDEARAGTQKRGWLQDLFRK